MTRAIDAMNSALKTEDSKAETELSQLRDAERRLVEMRNEQQAELAKTKDNLDNTRRRISELTSDRVEIATEMASLEVRKGKL